MRASRDIYVHRQNLVYSVHNVVGLLERAAADSATAYGYHKMCIRDRATAVSAAEMAMENREKK